MTMGIGICTVRRGTIVKANRATRERERERERERRDHSTVNRIRPNIHLASRRSLRLEIKLPFAF